MKKPQEALNTEELRDVLESIAHHLHPHSETLVYDNGRTNVENARRIAVKALLTPKSQKSIITAAQAEDPDLHWDDLPQLLPFGEMGLDSNVEVWMRSADKAIKAAKSKGTATLRWWCTPEVLRGSGYWIYPSWRTMKLLDVELRKLGYTCGGSVDRESSGSGFNIFWRAHNSKKRR